MRRTAFKRRELFQYFLCRRDYSERVVEIFANQIQSEYYGVNISVSIDGIALEHFSAVPQKNILIQLHHYVNGMQFFTLFYVMIANRMLPLLLHTANI